MKKPAFSIQTLTLSALIAALYVALTLLFKPISFGEGMIDFRISEALTILPVLFFPAVPGVTLGCLLANLLGSATPWDVLFGTLATLLAAMATRRLRGNVWLAALPPVVLNAAIVGPMLHLTIGLPLLPIILSVAVGEAVVVYALGVPLTMVLKKVKLPGWLADTNANP